MFTSKVKLLFIQLSVATELFSGLGICQAVIQDSRLSVLFDTGVQHLITYLRQTVIT